MPWVQPQKKGGKASLYHLADRFFWVLEDNVHKTGKVPAPLWQMQASWRQISRDSGDGHGSACSLVAGHHRGFPTSLGAEGTFWRR